MRKRKFRRLAHRIGVPAGLVLAASSTAFAQDAQVQDVVVTGPATTESFSQEQVEAFQSKPNPVTVITKRQIEALNITNLQQAQKLQPSLQIKFSNVRNLTINVRGFGAASSNATDGIFGGVPVYIDGVYQPRPGQAIFDIPDLVGVEVLKGPQGTSGGQDSTGGMVNLTTALPSFVAQQAAQVTYGKYNNIQVQAQSTGPIAETDWAAYRLAVFGKDRDGFIQNNIAETRYNDWHSKGARGQILLQPTNDLSARLVFDYGHVNQACCLNIYDGAVLAFADGRPVPNNFFQRSARVGYTPLPTPALANYRTDVNGYLQTAQESYGAAAIINYSINGYTLSSISAYRGWDFHPNNRNGNYINPRVFGDTNRHVTERSVQQEFRITTPTGQPVEASAGVFYLFEQLYGWGLTDYRDQAGAWFAPNNATPAQVAQSNIALNYLGQQTYDNPRVNSIAPFAQSVWHATPELDIVTGLRYSYTQKNSIFRNYIFAANSLAGLTPAQQATAIAARNARVGADREFVANTHQGFISARASAAYKFTPDVMGFVTYSRGGRAGGPNPTANLPATAPVTVLAEELDNYEVGVKSAWFDNKLLVNVAAFVMVDHNYITNVTSLATGTPVTFLANAKRAVSRGVELDVRAEPFEGLFLYGSMTYDKTYYGSFDAGPCPFELSNLGRSCNFTGQPLSLTPLWAFAVGGEYQHRLGEIFASVPKPVVGYLGADFTYQTSFYSDPTNSIYTLINPYGLLNAHAGLRFEDGSLDVSGWVNNALDKRYFINRTAATGFGAGGIGGDVGIPLTAGFTIRTRL